MEPILQLTDTVCNRTAVLRIFPGDDGLDVGHLLTKYLKTPDLRILLAEGRLTEESAESLLAIQDRVYSISNEGDLIDLNRGTVFKENGHILSLKE